MFVIHILDCQCGSASTFCLEWNPIDHILCSLSSRFYFWIGLFWPKAVREFLFSEKELVAVDHIYMFPSLITFCNFYAWRICTWGIFRISSTTVPAKHRDKIPWQNRETLPVNRQRKYGALVFPNANQIQCSAILFARHRPHARSSRAQSAAAAASSDEERHRQAFHRERKATQRKTLTWAAPQLPTDRSLRQRRGGTSAVPCCSKPPRSPGAPASAASTRRARPRRAALRDPGELRRPRARRPPSARRRPAPSRCAPPLRPRRSAWQPSRSLIPGAAAAPNRGGGGSPPPRPPAPGACQQPAPRRRPHPGCGGRRRPGGGGAGGSGVGAGPRPPPLQGRRRRRGSQLGRCGHGAREGAPRGLPGRGNGLAVGWGCGLYSEQPLPHCSPSCGLWGDACTRELRGIHRALSPWKGWGMACVYVCVCVVGGGVLCFACWAVGMLFLMKLTGESLSNFRPFYFATAVPMDIGKVLSYSIH